jgi:hypothetical protein
VLAAFAAATVVAVSPSAAVAQDDTITSTNAWVTDLIQAPEAWETTRGEGITVAVVDTGIGPHPFFDDKDVLRGYSSFPDEEDAWNDSDRHGTAVAAGVLLVAPEATILPVRMHTGATDLAGGLADGEVNSIRWAVDNGADILVMPWVILGEGSNPKYLEVLQYAIDKGAIVIAGAGNDPDDEVGSPASIPGVVGVTGTDDSGDIWYENTTVGPEVDVAAPAYTMLVPNPQLTTLGESELYREIGGGTSMGSGITGGVAALTWAAHPALDASNIIQRVTQTAGDGTGTRSEDAGYGLVNAAQAVGAEDVAPVEENPLGYPMGEPGASGATPDDAASEGSEGGVGPGPESAGPSASSAEGNKESNLSTVIVVAAAAVLIGAAIAVWLVLRGRGRKAAAAAEATAFNPSSGSAPGGFQQPAAVQQQYVPPMGGGQGYGAPPPSPQGYSSPPPGQQGFNPPASGAEQISPWRPSDPNRQ